MTCPQALLSILLLGPCDDGGGDAEAIAAAVASEARPAADVARDAGRKPEEVLSFFGMKPGMTVLDLFAGGGYYTQILDGVVGDEGRVLAHNNQGYLGFVGPQFEARFADGGLPNTQRVIAEANDLDLEGGSLDAALMILTYHDFLFGSEQFEWPDVDEHALLDTLCDAMKPGAMLGVIDHVAEPGGDPTQVALDLHRIDPAMVKADITGSCFDLVAETDLLANPDDDHSGSALEGPLRGRTDRFVYKFIRR
jgi:predicted methyltransferase